MKCAAFCAVVVALVATLPWMTRVQYHVHPSGVVFITGASSGIGLDAALHLDEVGYTVFAGVRSVKDQDRLQAEHPSLRPVLVDVTQQETVDKAAQHVEDHLATGVPLVGIVNNAGVSLPLPLELMPTARAQKVFDVNVFGVLRVSQRFTPLLRQHAGRIVNIGSVAGLVTTMQNGVYSGTKYALEAITDAQRLELAPWGVSVSIVEPAYVKTKIGDKALGNNNPAKSLAPEDYSLYSHLFEGSEAKRVKNFELADTTEVTNRAILHALTSPYPDTRYVVANANGIPAKLLTTFAWLAPDRLKDFVILKFFN